MFELLDQYQVKELHVRDDADSGLKAFIAIHNTQFGPALGGCRFVEYDNETQATQDVISLARGMSYKAALAGVPQGGGKAVIMKPKGDYDPLKLFTEFGRFVESLHGQYITAIDSGTSAKEMDLIQTETSYVTSTSQTENPSIYTAKGVFEGIKAAVKHRLHRDDLSGIKVALQGVGNVGMALGRMLNKAGAYVIVADVNQTNIDIARRDFASRVVSPEYIHQTPCEVFAPCGLSNVINDKSVDELGCMIVAGSANVQLTRPDLGQKIHDKGVLYAPDYVINAGGLVYASLLRLGHSQDQIFSKIEQIQHTLSDIFIQSDSQRMATSEIADALARDKLHLSKVTPDKIIAA